MFFFDPLYFLILAPAVLLMMWAQMRIKSTYARAFRVPARLSGAAAARQILDDAGLYDVGIEVVPGHLSDHYDPRARVLRLSEDVYAGQTAASVGIAAHEAGHALQHAQNYGPLVVRSIAVPAARFGPVWFMVFFFLGMFIPKMFPSFIMIAILGYVGVALFQLINLPVEFDASNRAKRLLYEMGITDSQSAPAVESVLGAAAWTYVAATLEAVLTVVYLLIRYGGGRSDD